MNVHSSQEVCPWNVRFAEVAAERDYAARLAWEAEWGRDPSDPDGDGPTEAVIPTTDGSALVDFMRMNEDEWDAYTRGSAMRRAGYGGLMRKLTIALGNWLAASDTLDPEAVGELVAESAAWMRTDRIGDAPMVRRVHKLIRVALGHYEASRDAVAALAERRFVHPGGPGHRRGQKLDGR